MRSEKNILKNQSTRKNVLLVLTAIVFSAILFMFFRNQNASATYNQTIDQGLEAVKAEDYEAATSYFQKALKIKSKDEKAEVLYHNSWLMDEAQTLYIDHEFDQSLKKVKQVFESESNVTELDLLLSKAEELEKNIEKIMADQITLQNDLDKAQAMYEADTLDTAQVDQILETLDHILAYEQIDESYHQEIKEATEKLKADVQTYQTEQKAAEIAKEQAIKEAKQKEQEAQQAKAAETKNKLSGYSALEIEYARIILMMGYPGSPTVYVHNSPAGEAVTSGYEETVKFPEPTVSLSGEIGADGLFVYTPLGDGYIRIYPVPGHWHQDDQSPAGYRAYAQEILDNAWTVYIDPGDPDAVLHKLQTTTFIID